MIRHLLTLLLLSSGWSPAATLAVVNARIYTISHGVIPQGTLVAENGRIVAVGPVGEVRVPAGAERIDGAGKVLLPGIVDTHSHIGLSQMGGGDVNESSGPTQGGVRAIDAILPSADTIRRALAGGLTTVNIMPGSGNIMGGSTAFVKLRGQTIEEMLLCRDGICGGMKMANGENPKHYGRQGQAPVTRMGVAALQRAIFVKAQNYMRKWDDFRAGKEKTAPDRDLELEPVVEVLQGKRVVHWHCHRADDILTALRLADEFKIRLVLQHVTEGYKVADEIAKRGVPASIIVLDSPGGKHEAADYSERNGAVLQKAGVKLAIHTDDNVTDSRLLLRSAALAVRGGLSEGAALRALTLNGAEILGLADRVGSLDPGKDADFVLLSGEPLKAGTKVLETWIEGKKAFDRANRLDRLYQTGGWAIPDRYPNLGGAQ